jgi:hypothetical protein
LIEEELERAIVGHHPSDLQSTIPSQVPELYFTAVDIAASLDPHRWKSSWMVRVRLSGSVAMRWRAALTPGGEGSN